MSSTSSNNSGLFSSNTQTKIKHEPVMEIGNKGYNSRRQGRDQNRRKKNMKIEILQDPKEIRNNAHDEDKFLEKDT